MRLKKTISVRLAAAAALMAALPQPLLACATCFGKSDSDLARGMNFGILSLLVVVVFVLGSIGAFFIYLARRAASMAGPDNAAETIPQGLSDDKHS